MIVDAMRVFSAADIATLSPHRELVEALRGAFRARIVAPTRHHHDIGTTSTLLLMPAWNDAWTGVKAVTIKTDNTLHGLPTLHGAYLLIENRTGAVVAVLDGGELTRRRTAAASALAADYLARHDAQVMTIVGAGALAPHFVRAHASVRPIKTVFVHSRTRQKASALTRELAAIGIVAKVADDLESAVRQSDIVTCVTTATTPVVRGAWLKPGAHLDLAGAFEPSMRECDGDAVARCDAYVDTRDGAAAEAGDLLQAQAEGRFDFAQVKADLADLCAGRSLGRESPDAITLFKSCGAAIEDLAAAVLVMRNARR